ncbi:uncharacterized protein F5891DRAFT_1190853 [Suillus fuscotomentosus]|uniref:Uncharacterized protein n=1 Tax=Suillus fuscotomentosus TaxID=1912939 RepID=A0AAD4HI36_9AGAM|nr:uncharacterized protein F5891DRAFT_1190853 [Suillus fuscotomentosus]KAG1898470.1 hypothetical protein F5891DRAFT_1190853 [Suillus fuscotomentosus]
MSASVRPTLPPLHTLNLPRGEIVHPRIDAKSKPQNRRVSISSSASSRTPSPTPSPPSSSRSSIFGSQPVKFRIVPTTFEHANAMIVIPDPDAPHVHPLSGAVLEQPAPNLFLVGPAFQCVRQLQRQIAKGIRDVDVLFGPESSISPDDVATEFLAPDEFH